MHWNSSFYTVESNLILKLIEGLKGMLMPTAPYLLPLKTGMDIRQTKPVQVINQEVVRKSLSRQQGSSAELQHYINSLLSQIAYRLLKHTQQKQMMVKAENITCKEE